MGRYKTSSLKHFSIDLTEDERLQADKTGKSLRELVMLGLQNTTTNAETEEIYERIAAANIKKHIDGLNTILLRHGRAPITDLSWSQKAVIRKQAITAYNNEVQEEKKGEEHEHDSELL